MNKKIGVQPLRSVSDIQLVNDYLKTNNYRAYVLWQTGLNTGLRISDLLRLNVRDVQNKMYMAIIEQKTQKIKRFPIVKNLQTLLNDFCKGRNPDEPLFTAQRSIKRMDRTNAWRYITEACKKVGITEKVGTHTMRKTFGYHHYKQFHDAVIFYETIKEAKRDLWKFDEVKTNDSVKYGFIFQNFLKKVETKNAWNTYDNYNRYYNMYLKPYDDIPYEKVNSLHWQDVFDKIAKDNSPHVAGITLKFCKAAVNHFIKHDLLEKNVFNKIELIKPPKADINHLTIEELKYVLEVCKKCYKEYFAILYTFIGTGAREAEIFALEKSDVDFERNCITVSKQFNKGKLLQHPKTEHSNRQIYIFEDLKEVLREHIKTLNPDNPLLFPNRAGNYINASNFRERFWKKLLELCKITKRVRLHDLRGSYTDMTLSSGLSIKFTQNQLGHSKAETTTNIYMRNNQDMINHAMDKLNNIFEKNQQNVSKILNDPNKKIIPFRKKQSGTCF